jgi:hypothetical protein
MTERGAQPILPQNLRSRPVLILGISLVIIRGAFLKLGFVMETTIALTILMKTNKIVPRPLAPHLILDAQLVDVSQIPSDVTVTTIVEMALMKKVVPM